MCLAAARPLLDRAHRNPALTIEHAPRSPALTSRHALTGVALQRAVRSAVEETDRLSRLANDLLLLARADDRQLAVHPQPVSAAELMQAASDRAGDPRVVIDAGEDATVLVDRARAGQALDNLLTNAQRYARREILLMARPRDSSVELHVLDDGPGFPVGFLPRAWDRFARADAGRTQDGVGLGLAIVRTIADLHGGSTGAANRAHGGADVWIELPAARSPPPPAPPDHAGSRA